jgi:hypothetical protein
VRGRPVVSGEEGLLLDLRGILGHVPAADARELGTRGGLGRAVDERECWVVAVTDDLVHLAARRPGARGDEGAIRRGIVVGAGPHGARVRLDGETSRDGQPSFAVVPWDELSWEPSLGPPSLEPGAEVAGRVVGLTLAGPILSPRSVVPTPWPAIALAVPPGTRVGARVEACSGGRALLRTATEPRAAAVVPGDRLPEGSGPGTVLEATVVRVNPPAGALELDGLSASSRAPPRAPAARTPERPGHGRAASGSCS